MPNLYLVVKYRQKRQKLKRALSLVFMILVILEKLIGLFKSFPNSLRFLYHHCVRSKSVNERKGALAN